MQQAESKNKKSRHSNESYAAFLFLTKTLCNFAIYIILFPLVCQEYNLNIIITCWRKCGIENKQLSISDWENDKIYHFLETATHENRLRIRTTGKIGVNVKGREFPCWGWGKKNLIGEV